MQETTDQARLLAMFRRRPPLPAQQPLLVAATGSRPPQDAVCLGVCRFHLVYTGYEPLVCELAGTRLEQDLPRGTWVFIPPHAWTQHGWQSVHRTFGIVCHDGFTRFLSAAYDGQTDRRRLNRGPDLVHHSPRPLPPDARHLLTATQHMPCPEGWADEAILHVLQGLLLLFERELSLPATADPGGAKRRWQEVVDYLRGNAHRPIDRNTVAQTFGLHPASLSRLFARFDEESLSDRLCRYRLERACRLLNDRSLDLETVARNSGFSCANYFAKVFRKRFGVAPSRYRAAR